MLERVRDSLDELARRYAHDHHCPTISWGVVLDGGLALHGSVGTLHDGTAPEARTVYRIASMTKSFTAATVLALRDEGVWSLDDPVARHAPELASVRGPEGSAAITLRHLLSMTAGIVTDDPWADRHLDATPEEIDEVYAAGPRFAHLVNEAFEYSNLGYGMLGRAVVRATGTRLQDHVTARFLGPLGLVDTTWVEPGHDRWARPHRWQDGQHVPDLPHPIGDGEISPMGGLWTTVADLARWVAWLDSANSTPHQPDAIGLSPASRREMQRFHTYCGVIGLAGRDCPTGYGFGLNVRDDPALGKVVSHSGGLPGYGSNMRWLAGRGVGAIGLANTTYAPMSSFTMEALVAVHDLGAVPIRPVKVSPALRQAAEALVSLLNDWDDARADELFADNVALDESFDRRRAAAEALVATHGPFTLVTVHPDDLATGAAEVRGAGEPFRISLTLAPVPGIRVQDYELPGEHITEG